MKPAGFAVQQRTGHAPLVATIPKRTLLPVCQAAKVSFDLYCQVPFGTALVLVGGCEELGSWKVGSGVQMTWSEGDHWVALADLPVGQVEYKYVKMEASTGSAVWLEVAGQGKGNLVVDLPGNATEAEVKDVTGHIVAAHVMTLGKAAEVTPAGATTSVEAEALVAASEPTPWQRVQPSSIAAAAEPSQEPAAPIPVVAALPVEEPVAVPVVVAVTEEAVAMPVVVAVTEEVAAVSVAEEMLGDSVDTPAAPQPRSNNIVSAPLSASASQSRKRQVAGSASKKGKGAK